LLDLTPQPPNKKFFFFGKNILFFVCLGFRVLGFNVFQTPFYDTNSFFGTYLAVHICLQCRNGEREVRGGLCEQKQGKSSWVIIKNPVHTSSKDDVTLTFKEVADVIGKTNCLPQIASGRPWTHFSLLRSNTESQKGVLEDIRSRSQTFNSTNENTMKSGFYWSTLPMFSHCHEIWVLLHSFNNTVNNVETNQNSF
jgi:hypothetical protein